MSKFIIQWDFARYTPPGKDSSKLNDNKLWAKLPIEAINRENALQEIGRINNINPFYLTAIPLEDFDKIITGFHHPYMDLQY